MELKSIIKRVKYHSIIGSNRTFMELKFSKLYRDSETSPVLIAPLWN